MKLSIKLLAILTALVCLMSCLGAMPFDAASGSSGGNVRYTQKIVSVLYDNSGSMNSDNKNDYALYALQMLMALLDDSDVLVITPMNENSKTVTSTSAGITVDLAAKDRDAQIQNAMTSQSSFLSKTPSGETPGSSIAIAVDRLEQRGLKDRDNLTSADPDKEYWLVILTDGAFNEQSYSNGADKVIESHIANFPSLRTIYLGLGSSSPDLSGTPLTQKMPFTPYRAATTDDIVNAMQSVANQLSGRYTLDSSSYTVNGSSVTIDLSKYELSFKSISVIAQDCGQTLKSAKHNGKDMPISQPCVITPKNLSNIQNGFSAVLSGSPYISGGKITLEFSGPIKANNLSILAEPALVIQSYLEYYNGTDWERTTMQYINANLSKDDKIRVGYEVYEQANGTVVDISKIFGDCTASVTYAGSTFDVGAEIPLVVGNNEIGVSVSVMDGAYTMYSSVICIIEENPTYYRVEVSGDTEISVTALKSSTVFSVYSNNLPISAKDLANYTWSVSVKAPDGTDAKHTATVGPDGKITVEVSADHGEYGDYQLDFIITSEHSISRSASVTLRYYPKSIEIKGNNPEKLADGVTKVESNYTIWFDGRQLSAADLSRYVWQLKVIKFDGTEIENNVTVSNSGEIKSVFEIAEDAYGLYNSTITFTLSDTFTDQQVHQIKKYPNTVGLDTVPPGSMSLSQYQITVNTAPLQFELSFDGRPFPVNNGLTEYKITVDGVDVTQYAYADGNILNYVPLADHFGGNVPLGEKTVTVSMICGDVSASATAKFAITETLYEVVSLDTGNKKINRFELDKLDAALYFAVLRDGEPLPIEELQAALDSGAIKISDKSGIFGWQVWIPCGKDVFVDTVDETPVVVFKVTKDWIKPFDTFAAMLIFNKSASVSVTYNGVSGSDAIVFPNNSAWSYIWRILVILFVIHCILYLIGFFNKKCKSLPTCMVVSASIGDDSDEVNFRIKNVNFGFMEKYGWHLARFIPHKRTLWYDQEAKKCGKLIIGYDENGELGVMHKESKKMYRVRFDNNGSQAGDKFSDFKRELSKYNGKGARPKIKGEKLTGAEVRSIFRVSPDDAAIPPKTNTNYDFFGQLNEDDGSLSYAVFVVYRS